MTHIKALKLARDCIRDSVEYKQGKATAIEAVEDIDEALAQPPVAKPHEQEPTNCRHCGGADDVICAGQCKDQPAQPQQAYAMAQVCLDLHEALGCKWGDNPYLALAGLREEQPQQEPVYKYCDDGKVIFTNPEILSRRPIKE